MKSLLVLVLALALPAPVAKAEVTNSSRHDVVVWFYRPADSPLPQAVPTLFEVGGLTRKLARLAPGEFFGYRVQPGVHTFCYTRAPAAGQSLQIMVRPGQEMYVEVQFRQLQLVTSDIGRAAIGTSRAISDLAILDKSVTVGFGTSGTTTLAPVPEFSAETTRTSPAATRTNTAVTALPLESGGPIIISWPTVANRPAKTAASKAATSPAGPAASPTPAVPPSAPASTVASPAVTSTPKPAELPVSLPASRPASSPTTTGTPSLAATSRPAFVAATSSTSKPGPSTTSTVPALRAGDARAAWPEQPALFTEVFSKATLNLQTGRKKQELEATVAFDKNGVWLLDPEGKTLKAFLYSNIRIAEYSNARSAWWQNIGSGAPSVTSGSGNTHWFLVQTQNDYALLSLDTNNYRSVVGAFELRSGKSVDIAAESD